jgi:hypothetical protein
MMTSSIRVVCALAVVSVVTGYFGTLSGNQDDLVPLEEPTIRVKNGTITLRLGAGKWTKSDTGMEEGWSPDKLPNATGRFRIKVHGEASVIECPKRETETAVIHIEGPHAAERVTLVAAGQGTNRRTVVTPRRHGEPKGAELTYKPVGYVHKMTADGGWSCTFEKEQEVDEFITICPGTVKGC